MKNRLLLSAALFQFLILAALCVTAFLARRGGCGNLLLAVPADLAAPRLDVMGIEQFCDDTFLLTYEIPSAARAAQSRSGSQAEYPVTLIGTNSAYPHILGLTLAEGSFFSKQAWEGKLKQAVLNEKAAFTIFGSSRVAGNRLRLRGDTWLVSGVIRDGDEENSRIYIPSTVPGQPGGVLSLMALMDAPRGLNEAYAKNSLKSLGVQGGSFKFYNLETQARLPEERALAALGIFLSLILMRLLPWLGGSITVLFLELRGELTSRYLRELIAARLSLLARCAGLTLALALAAGSALTLILRVVSLCLPWQDIPALSGLSREFFDPKLRLLRSCDLSSQVLFYGALILMVLMVVSSVFTRQRTAGLHGPRKDHPGP